MAEENKTNKNADQTGATVAAEQQSEIARLQAELVNAKKENDELRAEIAKQVEAQSVLMDSNTELQTKLEESEKTVEEVKVIVKNGKDKYEVITPRVQYAGTVYLAADLKKHPDVVKALVEKGSGVLKAL